MQVLHQYRRYAKQPKPNQLINWWVPSKDPVDVLSEPRLKLKEYHKQLRKEEDAWMSNIRKNLLNNEKRGVGVMEATKYAREFVALVKQLSPHTI